MNNREFGQVLKGAVAGSHQDLEHLLELYEPLIQKHSYVNGEFDKELHQYLLIHIALNIHKFTI